MKKYFLILAVFITAFAGAQIPGFQGKRFIVKYDLGIMHPAIVGRTGKPPMLYHGLALDYTVARAWSVGVKGNFMTINAPTDKKAFQYYNYNNGSGLDYRDYPGRYTQVTVGFYAKKFAIRKGYLAPMGRYIVLGVYYQYAVDNITLPGTAGNNSNIDYSYSVTRKKVVAHFGGITVGMGRNFIVSRRMVIDLGFTLNVAPVPHVVFSDEDDKMAVYRDLMLRNIFQVHLGFGALAF
jgi:hypothetical protein